MLILIEVFSISYIYIRERYFSLTFFPFLPITHTYFLSSDISTTYSSLLLSSGCFLSFLYVSISFFPHIPFSSHLVSLPLLILSSLLNHNSKWERRVNSDYFLKSWFRILSSSSASPLWQPMVQRSSVFLLGPAQRAKGNSSSVK